MNWLTFDGHFDTTGYLSQYSDIVALMVFEHQMHLMNLLSRIGWERRVADFETTATVALRTPGRQDDSPIPVRVAAKEIVDYLLFVDEAPLAGALHGSSGLPSDSQPPERAIVRVDRCASSISTSG